MSVQYARENKWTRRPGPSQRLETGQESVPAASVAASSAADAATDGQRGVHKSAFIFNKKLPSAEAKAAATDAAASMDGAVAAAAAAASAVVKGPSRFASRAIVAASWVASLAACTAVRIGHISWRSCWKILMAYAE